MNDKWKEINEAAYMEALECLPPENWKRTCFGSIFRFCEYWDGNITQHYAALRSAGSERFFTARREAGNNYPKLLQEIHNQFTLTY